MAKKKSKELKVTCDCKEYCDVNLLNHFQGNLKTLHEKQAEKIKESFIKYGISFPVFIWEDGKKKYIIDGHQRVHILKEMIKEGYKIEGDGKMPVVFVEAESKKEAIEKVLLATSRYGRIDQSGAFDFFSENEINVTEMNLVIDLPELQLDSPDLMLRGGEKYDETIEKFAEEGGKSEKDEKYFYVEFYGDKERFEELMELMSDHLVSGHEIESNWFYNLVKGSKNG